jgi:hypothetical protein
VLGAAAFDRWSIVDRSDGFSEGGLLWRRDRSEAFMAAQRKIKVPVGS